MSYADCVAKYDEPSINDLYGGFDVVNKLYRKGLCSKIMSARSGSHTFVDTVLEVTTSEQFDAMKNENLQTTSANSYTEPSLKFDAYLPPDPGY